jgi:hypothetical protein
MHVTVDEAWHQVRPCLAVVGQLASPYLLDALSIHYYFTIEHLAANHINDIP